MFTWLAAFVFRHRWGTLIASVVFLVGALATVLHGGNLTGGSFGDREAEQTQRLVENVLGHSTDTTFVAVFHSESLAADSKEFGEAMAQALAPLTEHPDVLGVVRPHEAPRMLGREMVNTDAKSAIAIVNMRGTFKEAINRYPDVREALRSDTLEITCTGKVPFLDNFDRVLQHDMIRSELLSLPLALLVLLLVFRTGVAAALPVGVGALAVLGGIAVVVALSNVMDIAEYAVNVCSLLGLGVAIDYSLFIVTRYREELDAGHDYPVALERAVERAGKVVCFSGLVLVTGVSGLLFFKGSFLYAMGVGGIVVVLLAIVFALTFLPAVLAVLGPRINAWPLRIKRLSLREGTWHRAATWVMRRPFMVLLPTLALLGLMASPFLRLEMTEADVRVLREHVEARKGFEILKRDFPEFGSNRVVMAVSFPSAPALDEDRIAALHDLSQRIAAIPNVRAVRSIVSDARLSKEEYQFMLLHPPAFMRGEIEEGLRSSVGERVVILYALLETTPESHASQAVIRELRSHREVGDGTLSVGGQTASDMDATEFVRDQTPRAIAFVMGVTFVILFLLLGSLVLPLKAIVMNLLSISGSFGALVWVFQEGHWGISDPRPVEHALPVLLFCVVFGLSMDYEVLMLSRIKESWERTEDNTLSVAEGLEKTAGLITSAATIMIVVFSAFALATIVLIRAMGMGMALAVLIDATVVRLLVVPATMRLFGKWNWWAPAPMLRLRALLGIR